MTKHSLALLLAMPLAFSACGKDETKKPPAASPGASAEIKPPPGWSASLDSPDFVSCNLFVISAGTEVKGGCLQAGADHASEVLAQCVPGDFSGIKVDRTEYRTTGCAAQDAWAACDFVMASVVLYPATKAGANAVENSCKSKAGRWYLL